MVFKVVTSPPCSWCWVRPRSSADASSASLTTPRGDLLGVRPASAAQRKALTGGRRTRSPKSARHGGVRGSCRWTVEAGNDKTLVEVSSLDADAWVVAFARDAGDGASGDAAAQAVRLRALEPAPAPATGRPALSPPRSSSSTAPGAARSGSWSSRRRPELLAAPGGPGLHGRCLHPCRGRRAAAEEQRDPRAPCDPGSPGGPVAAELSVDQASASSRRVSARSSGSVFVRPMWA